MQPLRHIENIYHLQFLDLFCFFLFYPFWKINTWTIACNVYFNFVSLVFSNFLNILNEVNHRIHQHYNFICIIIRCKFYPIALWVHWMLVFSIFWRNKSQLQLLTGFSLYQNFEDQLLYSPGNVQSYWSICQMISFYFYHHYFCIKYNYYSRSHLLFITYFFSLFKKCPNISNCSAFS